jgi:mannose-6-phosphate isomerase-like protein (cupin superfamily)
MDAVVLKRGEGRLLARRSTHGSVTLKVANAGTTVYLPRGIFHAFRSTGRVEGRIFGVGVPGGIEDVFEEASRSCSWLDTAPVALRRRRA